jgi:hypothetical protein
MGELMGGINASRDSIREEGAGGTPSTEPDSLTWVDTDLPLGVGGG